MKRVHVVLASLIAALIVATLAVAAPGDPVRTAASSLGNATADALDALDSRVTSVETKADSNSSKIADLDSRVAALELARSTTPDPDPTPPPPATSFVKGLATGFRFGPSVSNVKRAADAGADAFREEYTDQATADSMADAATANGLRWELLVLGSNLGDLNLLSTIAARYGPGGAHPAVDVIELGNEPYWDGSDVGTYAKQVKAAIGAIKAANPAVKTTLAIGPSIGWIDSLEAAAPGVLAAPDYFTHHPYSNRSTTYGDPTVYDPSASDWDQSWQRFKKLHEHLVSLGHDQPFLLTETGWHTKHDYGNGVVWTEAQQADFIAKAYSVARGLGWVAGLNVFSLDDNPNCGSTSPEAFYGLLRCDGSQKPSYAAFKSA